MKKIILYTVTLLIVSCTMAPNLENHEIKTPEKFTESKIELSKDSLIQNEWWKQYNDLKLNAIVDSVLNKNLDLKIMIERIKQFEALVGIQSAQLYPQLNMNGSYSKTKPVIINSFNFSPEDYIRPPEYSQYNLSGSILLNLDIWGKLRDTRSSALADWSAMKYDLIRFYQNLLAQSIRNYFDIISLRKELKTDQELLLDLLNEEAIQDRKYRSGIVSKFNVELAKQSSGSQEIIVRTKETQLKMLELQLAYLLGEATLSAELSDELPDMNLKFYNSINSKVVQKRADVKAAFNRMESARYKVGVARADFFPQLSLTANAGWTTKSSSDIFDMDLLSNVWGLNIVQGIFNGFVNQSNLDKSWSEFAIAINNYQKTVLQAFQDVEKALYQMERSYILYDAQKKMFESGKNVLRLTEKRYLRGVGDYKQLIDIKLNFSQIERQAITQHKNHLLSGMQLYLALGGNWVKENKN
jgi:outer membrane protein, multidrug efflux system